MRLAWLAVVPSELNLRRVLAVLGIVCLAAPAFAQFVSPGGGAPGTGAGAAPAGVQNQGDNTTDTFANIQFVVQRTAVDPSQEGALRVILRVVENEKEGRRVALIEPQATVVDEMGNAYGLTSSTGIPICLHGRNWIDIKTCAGYHPDTPVILTPSQPVQTVLLFAPLGDNFSPELAAAAATGTLQARVAVFSADMSTQSFHDVVINGIALPHGGS